MTASQPEPGGDTGRVRCLYCGANNFPASAACWQCSRPLQAMRAALPDSSSPAQIQSPGPALRPAMTDSALAPKAAAALGMIFPYVGLPAGMIFLMLDDPRKIKLGWILIGWSLAGSVITVLSLAATLGPLWALLRGLSPHPGGSQPALPGVPSDTGEGLFLLALSLTHLFSRI